MACGIVPCFKTRFSSATLYQGVLSTSEISGDPNILLRGGGGEEEWTVDKLSSIQPPQGHEERAVIFTSPRHHWDVKNFYTTFVFGKKDTWIFSKKDVAKFYRINAGGKTVF